MSENQPNIQMIENNDEAYKLWKDLGISHATVLHIDAHLDYRDDPGLHIGNYLKQAITEQLIDTIYWVVPGDEKQFEHEAGKIKTLLKKADVGNSIVKTKRGIETHIKTVSVIVCPLELLPKKMQVPYVIDIDLDFLFFSSCLSADRTVNIGKRFPWLSPELLSQAVKPYLKNSILTTLCYSTTGGWTPMQYRHFGDMILSCSGILNNDIQQRIIAGNFYGSFYRYFKKNELQQAKKYYDSAIVLNPVYLSFYMTDGPLFLLKGDLKRAGNEFLRLQQIDPTNAYALFGQGLVELLSGNMKTAKTMMEKAKSITGIREITLFLIYIQSLLGEHINVKKLLMEKNRNIFPEKPLSKNVLTGILNEISQKLESEHRIKNIGQMYLYPNPKAVSVWKTFVKYSPNNIGNWTEEPTELRHTTAAIELDLIEKMSDLYFGNTNNYGGYMTSGATEGNIFSAWIGRKHLENIPGKSQIVLLANNLTHYSILKAADITGVTVKNVHINTQHWNTDPASLSRTIRHLHKKGICKFLIPLTLGYTVGGTNDDVLEIVQTLKNLKREIQYDYFLWIDAALSGFTMPFLAKDYKSFFQNEIGTIVVDFHKALGIPMPAGMILYKKELAHYVKKPVAYLSVADGTLLGSRSGVAPIAAWISIHQLGFTKLKQLLQKELKRKNEFLKKIKEDFPHVSIRTDKYSLHAAVSVTEELPQRYCEQYGLHLRRFNINNHDYLIYPVFFLPEWS